MDLKFLRSSYGILILIACKYIIWPFLKMFGGRLLRNCEYYFFYFFIFFIFLFIIFFIFIISVKWWNDVVEYFNPPPAAAAAAPPPNLRPLEELLRQQLTILGEIKLFAERAAPVQHHSPSSAPPNPGPFPDQLDQTCFMVNSTYIKRTCLWYNYCNYVFLSHYKNSNLLSLLFAGNPFKSNVIFFIVSIFS